MSALKRITERMKAKILGLTRSSVLDVFVHDADAAKNAVDIFKGEWASKLPDKLGVEAGSFPAFDDERIKWANEKLSFSGRTALELGPLEAGHTAMLQQFGAKSILALEANTRAFLKCLIVKELLDLDRAKFLCVDFMDYMDKHKARYDVCVASGVLYHARDPVRLLDLICQSSDRVFLWTHYYDAGIIPSNKSLSHRFTEGVDAEYRGFKYTYFRREYGTGLYSRRSFGGTAAFSHWLPKDDILRALKHFGMTNVETAFEEPRHQSGPAFALVATRQG